MLEKKSLVILEGKEYQLTRVFEPELKAQEAFWKRYFTMATKILSDSHKKECKKVVKYEKCNSVSAAQH